MKIISFFIFLNISLFAFFENISTFQSSFRQIVTSDGKEIIYSGLIFIKRPNSILWKYQYPIEKSIYIRDRSLFMVEPDLEQVIIKSISTSFQLINLLEDSQKIDENRYSTKVNEKEYLFILKNSILHRVIYNDELGNFIEVTFTNPKIDKEIGDNLFIPNIPNYFDRIYQ